MNISHLSAQVGGLDSTFGVNGEVLTSLSTIDNTYDGITASALQPDGKILVTGNYWDDTIGGIVATIRYNTNGIIDSSFGINGIVYTFIDSFANTVAAMALQKDGKIVISGKLTTASSGYYTAYVLRYNSNGTIDNSFGTNGVTKTIVDTSTYISAISLQSDGKIIASGEAGYGTANSKFCTIRYNTNGTLDYSFGLNGIVTTAINYYSCANAIAIQSDGKIVVAGYSGNSTGINYFTAVRYDTTGIIDSSFGSLGIAIVSLNYYNDQAYAVAIQQNGEIILGGESWNNNSQLWAYGLARLSNNGILDNKFGIGGIVITTIGAGKSASISCIALQYGKILAAGSSIMGGISFALVRYNNDGSIDSSVFTDGVIVTDFDGAEDFATAILLQPDGKAILTGHGSESNDKGDYALARYQFGNTATTNITPLDIKTTLYPNPSSDIATLQYTLGSNENISISLYDIQGRLIVALLPTQNKAPGVYTLPIDMHRLAKGVYTVQISDGERSMDIKMEKE